MAGTLPPLLARRAIKTALRQCVQVRLRAWLSVDCFQDDQPEMRAPVDTRLCTPAIKRPTHQQAADAAIQERLDLVLGDILEHSSFSAPSGFVSPRHCPPGAKSSECGPNPDGESRRGPELFFGPKESALKNRKFFSGSGRTLLDDSGLVVGAPRVQITSESRVSKSADLPVIGAFAPLATEVDVTPFLRTLASAGVQLALPICEPTGRIMSWTAWDGDLAALHGQSPLHLRPAPSLASTLPSDPFEASGGRELLPDIVIVPLVAFDRELRRLGRGGGFYDATLFALKSRKEIASIGLAYEVQSLSTLDFAKPAAKAGDERTYRGACPEGASPVIAPTLDWTEAHDMALDIILTECNILRHGKKP